MVEEFKFGQEVPSFQDVGNKVKPVEKGILQSF